MHCEHKGLSGVSRSYQRVTSEPRISSLIVILWSHNNYTYRHELCPQYICLLQRASSHSSGTSSWIWGACPPLGPDQSSAPWSSWLLGSSWPSALPSRAFIKLRGESLSCIITLGACRSNLIFYQRVTGEPWVSSLIINLWILNKYPKPRARWWRNRSSPWQR